MRPDFIGSFVSGFKVEIILQSQIDPAPDKISHGKTKGQGDLLGLIIGTRARGL